MTITRRKFLCIGAGLFTAQAVGGAITMPGVNPSPIKAIAFDAFPIFDPRPVFDRVKKLFPAVGQTFSSLWRSRIFEYTWLLTSARRHEDFWVCIDKALLFTARQLNITLSQAQHQQLMNGFLTLKAYPDVRPILTELKAAGIRLAFLSNMTDHMLLSNIKYAGLQGLFDAVLSTDRVATFKPDPRAYQLAVDTFKLPKEEIAFTAFASWDAIGAKWFGYPTVWINRLNFKAETLQAQPDLTGQDLNTLKDFILRAQTRNKG